MPDVTKDEQAPDEEPKPTNAPCPICGYGPGYRGAPIHNRAAHYAYEEGQRQAAYDRGYESYVRWLERST